MGRSSNASDGKWSQSNTPMTNTNCKQPGGLTSSPSFAHFVYVLTIYRYVLLCLLFGAMSVITGVSLLSLALVFRAKTSSTHLLESVPLYMPGLILICNGTSMIAFMNKHTRRFYLLKSVCGLFLLVALLLIIVSVTTSVIHIPRLHSHRECAYTQRLRACTCVQNLASSSIASKHFIMEEIDNCELVHGIIYDSLRVAFALSLISILISVFSIMTLYQLYIHEKQKIYFSQLNTLRHRIHQRNVMLNLDSNGPQSIYMDHFNHLYSVDAIANECGYLPQNKSLSAEFSSQDMLLDQSSTNFGVSNPKDPSNLSGRGRIWSSQSSNFVQSTDHRSESVNLDKAPKTACMRRYMSVIFDRSNNVQSYVRQKLNPFRRIHSMANERRDKRSYNKVSKSQLLPPHVTIPRFSMGQSSIDSSNGNYSINRTPVEHMRKSVSIQSTSSSHQSTSISSSSTNSKQAQSHVSDANQSAPHSHLSNAQTESSYNHQSGKKRSSEQTITSVELYKHESSSHPSDLSAKTTQNSNGGSNKMESYHFGQRQSNREVIGVANWSHSSMMDTFRCIDEDDFANSDHFQMDLEQSQLARFGHDNENNLYMESKPLEYKHNTSSNISPEEVPSITPCTSTKFTFGSQIDNRRYMTTFEEAFKNYYDSQHRISSQNCQYFTLPIKSSKDRSKRKTLNSRPEPNAEFKASTTDVRAVILKQSEPQCHPMYCQQTNHTENTLKCDQNQADVHLMSEDEFPAIEPPADYKNVATIGEIIPSIPDNESKTRTMESLTNQLLQPYQYWIQQFIEQMNQTQQMLTTDTAKMYNPTSMEEFDTVANGFIEDDDEDGAGDTSTSQDIADFEFELDEEPIKFIGDDEYKAKLEVKQGQANKLPIKVPSRAAPVGLEANHDLNLLKKNTDLIRRAVQQNKATADYGFDGFRKGCFDEEDDSSTSTESSLSNGTHSSEKSTNSITAEYIKPPTPFTNYYVNN